MMTQRTKAIQTLRTYFQEKGRVLTALEYSRETDTPIRYPVVRNMFGTWSKMENIIMASQKATITFDGPITDVDEVLRARNESAIAAENTWKAASENQDAKATREVQAQIIAEKLALNARTAAGANANKLAIGGPLPQEQPELERMGATVKIDPVTAERTPVDSGVKAVDPYAAADKPEGVGSTPQELKAALLADDAGADEGDVPTGTATDGGSSGAASISTVAAAPAGGTADTGTNADKVDSSTDKDTNAADKTKAEPVPAKK